MFSFCSESWRSKKTVWSIVQKKLKFVGKKASRSRTWPKLVFDEYYCSTISRSFFAVILLFNRSKIDILFTARILLNQGNESEKGWPAGQSRPWPSVKYDEMTTRICPFSFFSDKIWSNQIERTSLRGYDVINEFRHKYAIGNWKWTIILSKRSREIIT